MNLYLDTLKEKSRIVKALGKAGYTSEPTEESLIECFMDYVDCGVFGDLDSETALDDINLGIITVNQMCNALIKMK